MSRLRFFQLFALVLLILAVPALAMQYTDAVDWSPADFMKAGLLLFGAVFGIYGVLQRVVSPAKRYLYVVLILTALLLIWGELAVGI